MKVYPSFSGAYRSLEEEFRTRAHLVHAPKWQAMDVSRKPEMAMRELFPVSFSVPLRGIEELKHWQGDIMPNLPFADTHFAERIGGLGTNPGEAWKIWPWGNSADAHRTEQGRFTHTYQERFWPTNLEDTGAAPQGIRYRYADYMDLITHLSEDPLSRQAYLPIWFPEDGSCTGRKPCTLGYHFFMRFDYLHIVYYIRSCDFVRHFRDDCYFTVRLLLHTLELLRNKPGRKHDLWMDVKPGLYIMHITSLHCFVNDWIRMGGVERAPQTR